MPASRSWAWFRVPPSMPGPDERAHALQPSGTVMVRGAIAATDGAAMLMMTVPLEVSPMALYRHVADKDDRITTMEAHGCRRSTRASVPSYEGARGHLCDDPIPEGHVVDDGGQDSDHRGCAGVWVVRSIGLEHQWDASRCSSLELPTPAPSCHCRRDAWPHRRPLLADGFTGRMLTLCPTTTADPIFSVKDAVAR